MIDLQEQPLNLDSTPVGGQVLNNVNRISIGDGSLRIEGGAMIVSDENGVDRVLIGYGEDLF